MILLTVHSGVGGEGERLRSALEGSGLDEAGFTLEQIRVNMAALQGAEVQLGLGEEILNSLELATVARVPAMDIQRYFDLPFDDALEMVAVENDPVRAVLDTGEPVLAFGICGWHLPGEVWGQGGSATIASIYLGFIRLRSP